MKQIKEKLSEHPELLSKKVSLILKKSVNSTRSKDVKKKFIEELNESNKELEMKIKVLSSKNNCLKENEDMQIISQFMKETERLENQLQTEKSQIKDLQKQIQQTETRILKKSNSKDLNENQVRDLKNVEKRRDVWREKVHAASCRLGTETAKTFELKEKIKTLMSDRKIFNKEYNTLLEKLKGGKVVMEDLTNSFASASLLRENLTSKLQTIQEKENKQLQLQIEEAQTLIMRRDSKKMQNTFYLRKQKVRLSRVASRKKYLVKETLVETIEDYKWLTDEIVKASTNENSPKLIDYNDVIAKIKRENSEIMALFNYVTQQNHEIEVLKEQITNQEKNFQESCLIDEEEKYHHEIQKHHLEGYKEKLEESVLNAIEDKRSNDRILQKLYKDIETLVNLTQADVSPLLLLLGQNDQVTNFNYILFLQAVETKIISILEQLDLPNTSDFTPTIKEDRSRTFDSQVRKSPSSNEDHKMTITLPCPLCHPPDSKQKQNS